MFGCFKREASLFLKDNISYWHISYDKRLEGLKSEPYYGTIRFSDGDVEGEKKVNGRLFGYLKDTNELLKVTHLVQLDEGFRVFLEGKERNWLITDENISMVPLYI